MLNIEGLPYPVENARLVGFKLPRSLLLNIAAALETIYATYKAPLINALLLVPSVTRWQKFLFNIYIAIFIFDLSNKVVFTNRSFKQANENQKNIF